MSKRDDKREKLLRIAVEMYGRDGSFTARDLTSAAGMNIASLNYYFGSKEVLIQEIEQHLLQMFTHEITQVGAAGMTPFDRLSSLLFAVAERLLENPGMTRHFVEMLITGSERIFELMDEAVGRNSMIYSVLRDILVEIGVTDEEEIFRRMIIGVCSLAPVFVIGLSESTHIMMLREDSFVRSHIATLTQMLLAPVPRLSTP